MSERSVAPYSLRGGIDAITFLQESADDAGLPALTAYTPSVQRRVSYLSMLLKEPTCDEAASTFLESDEENDAPRTPGTQSLSLTRAHSVLVEMLRQGTANRTPIEPAIRVLADAIENRELLREFYSLGLTG